MYNAHLEPLRLELDTELLGPPVRRGLAHPVRRAREVLLLQPADARHRARDEHEFALVLLGRAEPEARPQRPEQLGRADGVRLEVEEQVVGVRGRDVSEPGRRPGVGDDHVDPIQAQVRHLAVHKVEGTRQVVGPVRRAGFVALCVGVLVEPDGEQLARGVDWDFVLDCPRGGERSLARGANDGVVRTL